MLFPCIYIKPDDDIKKSFNGKTKVRVRKLFKSLGQRSWLIMQVAELFRNKNWRSAWLILLPDRNSWYSIQRIHLRKTLKESKEFLVNNNLNARSNQQHGFGLIMSTVV